MDASLGPGSAVRGNDKKRGEIAKKKSANEATISLSQTTARPDPLSYLSFYAFSTHCGAGSQAMWMHTMVFGPYPKRYQMV